MVLCGVNRHSIQLQSLHCHVKSHPIEDPIQERPLPSEGSISSYEVIQTTLLQLVCDALEATLGEVDPDLKLN